MWQRVLYLCVLMSQYLSLCMFLCIIFLYAGQINLNIWGDTYLCGATVAHLGLFFSLRNSSQGTSWGRGVSGLITFTLESFFCERKYKTIQKFDPNTTKGLMKMASERWQMQKFLHHFQKMHIYFIITPKLLTSIKKIKIKIMTTFRICPESKLSFHFSRGKEVKTGFYYCIIKAHFCRHACWYVDLNNTFHDKRGPDDEAERSHCKTTTARVSLRTQARVSRVNRNARLCVFIYFFPHM